MRRTALILASVSLIIGCQRNKSGSTDSPTPGAVPADLPKLNAKASFKVPGSLGGNKSLQLSHDGKTLAVDFRAPPHGFKTQVWDLSAKPKTVAEFDGGTPVLSPSGRFVATTGFYSREWTVYETATRMPIARLPNNSTHAFFRNDHLLISTTASDNFTRATKGRITVWDVVKNVDAGSFDIPDNRFSDALLANGGKEIWLFMANRKFEVECYDLTEKRLLRTVHPENDTGRPYMDTGFWRAVSPDGRVFAAIVGMLRFHDAMTGKFADSHMEGILTGGPGFVPGHDRFLGRHWAEDGDSVIYNWKTGKALAFVPSHSAARDEGGLAAASGDGRTLVSVTMSGEGLVFDIASVK